MLAKLARLIAEYCVNVKQGDEVLINASLEAYNRKLRLFRVGMKVYKLFLLMFLW